MIDPVTALATASAAFNVIKKGFEVGRDVESMAGDIGRWMGAVSDIKKSDEFAKKPPLFKKMVAAKSVEEEALQAFMAKKKAEEMRDELRKLISFTRGPKAWDELVRMEGQIRKERQKAIYDQKERQRHFWEIILGSLLAIIIICAGVGFLWLVIARKKTQQVSDLGLTILQNSGIV
jgi:hypothetical protein